MNEKLINVRKKKGITQKNISSQVGITERSYRNIERQTQNPNVYTALKIADALNVNINEIFNLNQTEFNKKRSQNQIERR